MFKVVKPAELLEVSKLKGQWADQQCFAPAISPSGDTVAFVSMASNLGIENPSKNFYIYLWDRKTRSLKAVSQGLSKEVTAQYKTMVNVANGGKLVTFLTNPLKELQGHVWIAEGDAPPQALSEWLGLGKAPNGEKRGGLFADGKHVWAITSDPIYNNGTQPSGLLYIEGSKDEGITKRITIPKAGENMGAFEVSADGSTVAFNGLTYAEKTTTVTVWLMRFGLMTEFQPVLTHIEPRLSHVPWGLALSGNGNVVVFQNRQADGKKEVDQVVAENWITHDRRIVSYDPWGNLGKVSSGPDATALRSFACNMDGSQITFAGTFVKPHQTSGPDSLAWSFLYMRDMNAGLTKKIP